MTMQNEHSGWANSLGAQMIGVAIAIGAVITLAWIYVF